MERLFSYGTLQRTDVQIAAFGRELAGRPDVLSGYCLTRVPIQDPAAAAELGETHYFNVEPAPGAGEEVPGLLFELTLEELTAADRYEEDAGYGRIRVTLRSGQTCWVYLIGTAD